MRGYCTSAHMCGPVRTRPGGKVEKIVVAGEHDGSGYTDSVDVYDIATNTWEAGGCSIRKGWAIYWVNGSDISQEMEKGTAKACMGILWSLDNIISFATFIHQICSLFFFNHKGANKIFQAHAFLIHLGIQPSLIMRIPSSSSEAMMATTTVTRSISMSRMEGSGWSCPPR